MTDDRVEGAWPSFCTYTNCIAYNQSEHKCRTITQQKAENVNETNKQRTVCASQFQVDKMLREHDCNNNHSLANTS